MNAYWKMSDRQALCFFVGAFFTVALIAYVVLGLAGGGWTTPASFFVPMFAGIVWNIVLTIYNISKI